MNRPFLSDFAQVRQYTIASAAKCSPSYHADEGRSKSRRTHRTGVLQSLAMQSPGRLRCRSPPGRRLGILVFQFRCNPSLVEDDRGQK